MRIAIQAFPALIILGIALILVKWPGVWRRKEWAGEGKEGKRRKGKERKRKVKSKSWERLAVHRKGNQSSKFIPFTNKQKEYSYGTTNITNVELTRSKTE